MRGAQSPSLVLQGPRLWGSRANVVVEALPRFVHSASFDKASVA